MRGSPPSHEFTHALVQSVAPRGVPTWLHEGLAVAFEPDGEEWAAAQLARIVAGALLQDLARGEALEVAFERQYLMSFDAFLDLLARQGTSRAIRLAGLTS